MSDEPEDAEPSDEDGDEEYVKAVEQLHVDASFSLLPDMVLRILVDICNDFGVGFGITVTVGGTQVSGTAIGMDKFMNDLSAHVEAEAGEDGKVVTTAFRHLALSNQVDSAFANLEGDETEDRDGKVGPFYLHLENATVWQGGTQMASGVYWRGRLAQVDGWFLGTMTASA